MAAVDLNIEGLDEFNKKIAELKDIKKIRSKGMSAARKAMKIVELSAKIGAAYIDDPATREDIQKNITIRAGSWLLYQVVKRSTGVILNLAQVKFLQRRLCVQLYLKTSRKLPMNLQKHL